MKSNLTNPTGLKRKEGKAKVMQKEIQDTLNVEVPSTNE